MNEPIREEGEMSSPSMVTIKYNRIVGLSLCNTCGTFISTENLARHLRQTHSVDAGKAKNMEDNNKKVVLESEPLTKSEEKLHNLYQSTMKSSYIQTSLLPKILNLRVIDGFKCMLCSKNFKTERMSPSHALLCKTPLGLKAGKQFKKVKLQSLLGGNKVNYFEVEDGDADIKESWLSGEMNLVDNLEITNQVTSTTKSKDSFLSTMNFNSTLDLYGMGLRDAVTLCTLSDLWGEQKKIYMVLNKYMGLAFGIARDNVCLKRHYFLDQPMHLLVQQETVTRYTKRLSRWVYFLINISRWELDTDHKPCIPAIRKSLTEKVAQLQSLSFNKSSDCLVILHELFMRLILTDGLDEANTVPLFMACSSVHQDRNRPDSFRFLTASELSPLTAAFLYFIRCVVANEVYGIGRRCHPENKEKQRSVEDGWKMVLECVSNNRDCGATYVQHCMGVCNIVRYSEMSYVRFIVCEKPGHNKCGIMDGVELSLKKLGHTVRSVQESTFNLLNNKLLLGFHNHLDLSFWVEVAELKDHYTERSNGFYFLNHPLNERILTKWKNRFANYIIKYSDLFNRNGELNKESSSSFIDNVKKFLGNIYWLLQVTSGGPARATEMALMQYKNSTESTRHFYIKEGRMFYVLFYHKGRDKRGGIGKPIVRFPDKQTSKLIFLYLLFVRTLEVIIIKKSGLNRSAENIGDSTRNPSIGSADYDRVFLFSVKNSALEEDFLRDSFEDTMKKYGIDMNTSKYRQYYSGVVKNFVQGSSDEVDSFGDVGTLHIQCGHSVGTANDTYGVSDTDMKHLDGNTFRTFQKGSILWHGALEIGDKEGFVEKESDSIQDQQHTAPVQSCSCATLHKKLDLVIDRVDKLTSLVHLLTENGVHGTHPYQPINGKNESRGEPRNDAPYSCDRVKQALRDITKDENADFRSDQQKQAILHSCNSRKDVMLILPTASGKSMVYFIPCILTEKKIIILILPLVALVEDVLVRCKEIGIQAAIWEDRFIVGSKLIVLSAEHVVTAGYTEFINECHHKGQLHCVVIDEIHLFEQWKDFRPVLNDIKKHIRPNNISVPILGMTATCPPQLLDTLCEQCSMDNPIIIRQPSSRTNISFRMENIHVDSLCFDVGRVLRQIIEEIKVISTSNRIIMYCNLIKHVTEQFNAMKYMLPSSCNYYMYHSKMSKEERSRNFQAWAKQDSSKDGVHSVNLIISTSAFGCGIDIPDVRAVLHLGKPNSIISFIQESGRGGRDGHKAISMVLNIKTHRIIEDNMSNEDQSLVTKPVVNDFEEIPEIMNIGGGRKAKLYGSMEPWLHLKLGECRRHIVENFNDGETETADCLERSIEPCDLCHAKSNNTTNNAPPEILCTKIPLLENDLQSQQELEHKIEMSPAVMNQTMTSTQSEKGDDLRRNIFFETPPPKRSKFITSINTYSTPTMSPPQPMQSPNERQLDTELKEIARWISCICAVCSVTTGKSVRHGEGFDIQQKMCYRNRCKKCGSEEHAYSDKCFMNALQGENSNSCWACGLRTNRGLLIHRKHEYGNRNCPHKNCIRTIIGCLEKTTIRKRLETQFPDLTNMKKPEHIVEWLRIKNEKDELNYFHVCKWIVKHVFNVQEFLNL